MTQVSTDVVSEQETEKTLWCDYMVALARKQENWRLYDQAWHDFVLVDLRTGSPEDIAYCEMLALYDASAKAEEEALIKWKACAYPLHGIHTTGDKTSS